MKSQQSTANDTLAGTSQGKTFSRRAKHVLEVVLVISALPLILPLMALVALLIKLDSKGPVFYLQQRHGQFDREFTVYKFRTLKADHCVIGGGGRQANAKDSRCTKFGLFLRRTSLDELPQFLNILKGDMALVGPRPHATDHNEYYGARIAQYWRRHQMRPGLTGLAQVRGYRGQTKTVDAMAERVKHDLDYIDNHSLWLDMTIIVLTFRELLFPRNAH